MNLKDPAMFDVVRLSRPVGRRGACLPEDVLPLKLALHRLGHYAPDPTTGWHPRFDGPLAVAIESFQRAEGLPHDGDCRPDGETLTRLNLRLGGGRPAVIESDGIAAFAEAA
jgi:hypothetical protein